MNSINLVGRLCAEPDLRRTKDGTGVCSYSVAVKRPMMKDTTDFIECVSWRQSAEYLSQYGHKGDIVAVSGSLQSREWTDKDGKKRKAWEVVTTSVELLSSKRNSEASTNTTQNQSGFPGGYGQPQQGYSQPPFNQQGYGNYVPIVVEDGQLPF